MLEALRQIPGPVFLAYFAVLSGIAIILGRWWIYCDGTAAYSVPEPTRFQPIAVAALRGGWKEAVVTALCSLWSQELLEIRGEGEETTFRCDNTDPRKLSPIEFDVLRALRAKCRPRDMLHDRNLRAQVNQHLQPLYREMEQFHLVRGKPERQVAWITTCAAAIILAAIGGAKLYLGVTHGRPVVFLVMLVPASLTLLFLALKPWSRATTLGRHYIGGLKRRIQRIGTGATGAPSSTMAVAVMGLGSAIGASAFGPLLMAIEDSKDVWTDDSELNSSYDGSISGCGGGGGCGGCGN